jgi:hypothetical protein
VVVVRHKRGDPSSDMLSYRVLGVFQKFHKKWFLQKPDEVPHKWAAGTQPSLRMKLRLLDRDRFGQYTAVKGYGRYSVSEVHRTISVDEVLDVKGHLSSI